MLSLYDADYFDRCQYLTDGTHAVLLWLMSGYGFL